MRPVNSDFDIFIRILFYLNNKFKIIFRADGRLNDILLNKDVRHDVLSSLPRFQQFHSSVTKFCFETVSGKHALRQSNKQQRQSLGTDQLNHDFADQCGGACQKCGVKWCVLCILEDKLNSVQLPTTVTVDTRIAISNLNCLPCFPLNDILFKCKNAGSKNRCFTFGQVHIPVIT